jgi:hypothetical protein
VIADRLGFTTSVLLLVVLSFGCGGDAGGDEGGGSAADFSTDSSDVADANEACGADFDRQQELCPSNASRDDDITRCVETYMRFASMGCGDEWLGAIRCAAEATYTCEEGPVSCEATQTPYFACQSAFTQRTGCTRLPSQDDKCPASRPLSFGCIAALPSNCEALQGGSTLSACCSDF